jgi:hypothetical protein
MRFYNQIQIGSSSTDTHPQSEGTNQIQIGSSNQIQNGSSNQIQNGSSNQIQIGSPNPNNLNPNEFKQNEENPYNDDDEKRGHDKMSSSSLKGVNGWISEYRPSDIVNALADRGLIGHQRRDGNNWVPAIKVWNEIAYEVWLGADTEKIERDIGELERLGRRLPKSAKTILAYLGDV